MNLRLLILLGFILSHANVTPARTSDLSIQETESDQLITRIENYENGKYTHAQGLLNSLCLDLDCDTPILESLYYSCLESQGDQVTNLLRSLKKEIQNRGIHFKNLDTDKSHSIQKFALKLFKKNGELKKKFI